MTRGGPVGGVGGKGKKTGGERKKIVRRSGQNKGGEGVLKGGLGGFTEGTVSELSAERV